MNIKDQHNLDLQRLHSLLEEMEVAVQQSDWDVLSQAEACWSTFIKTCCEKDNGQWALENKKDIAAQLDKHNRILKEVEREKKRLFDELRTVRKSQVVSNAYRNH